MRIPRLIWAGGPAEGCEIWLDPAQARHGVAVLRLKPGDLVDVAGPAGLVRARVTTARSRPPRLGLILEEGQPGEADKGPEADGPSLALALINLPRFDWAVEKAAELGAGEIWPLVCERVKPGLVRAASARLERWRRLAEEARKQCGRPRPLVVHPPVTTAEFLAAIEPRPVGSETAGFFLSPRAVVATASGLDGGVGLQENESGLEIKNSALVFPNESGLKLREDEPKPAVKPLRVLVGPEGGFSLGEEAAFLAAGLRPWRLSPLVLRAETAALAALALLQNWK